MSATTSLPLLSPLVTRILELSGFPPELKTKDIQQVFSAWEDDNGGFKIKWVDDTTALIIFNDPIVAKKAYLRTLMSPPLSLINKNGIAAKVRPYDKDDASAVIASVNARQRSRSNASGFGSPSKTAAELVHPLPESPSKGLRGHAHTPSFGRSFGHRRQQSGSNPNLPAKPVAAALFDAANGGPSPANRVLAGVESLNGIAGLPANPLVAARTSPKAGSSSAGFNGSASDSAEKGSDVDVDLSKLDINGTAAGKENDGSVLSESAGSAPANGAGSGRIGDAGKRLVAGALGIRHPGVVRNTGSPSSSTVSSPSSTPQLQAAATVVN
ncbi:uncharacterized protein PFL1_03382 [Pseudozyma flocculosa PF-1]|uniref:Uncharacterized protein n=2 Tax=Pseudozyma flocculosa TaxID=84751 RepID=A0A5C3F8M7_9BASI|nr:uncharacterized protein PFL1_03382 [Pseudozyma flocculosa PF-1]EPQ29093.1 hypothetical protein PFL1_03382 [Pseudozyma flocculosa PF-1]SPO40087.1 uncharacterized protein PSFLO_05569 [Pseudozyma flocculosa]